MSSHGGPFYNFYFYDKMRFPLHGEKVNVNVIFRFPNWSQGLWSNIQVYGNVAYYTDFHEGDDVDGTQENGSAVSATMENLYQNGQANRSVNYGTNQENIQCMTHLSSTQQQQQKRENTKFKWRCIMSVDNDEEQLQRHEAGAMFLTYGGRIVEKNVLNINDKK